MRKTQSEEEVLDLINEALDLIKKLQDENSALKGEVAKLKNEKQQEIEKADQLFILDLENKAIIKDQNNQITELKEMGKKHEREIKFIQQDFEKQKVTLKESFSTQRKSLVID